MSNEINPRTGQRDAYEVFPLGRVWDDWFHFGNRLANAFGGNGAEIDRLLRPALNVAENEQNFTITAELPGVAKEDVSLTIENGVLTIAGEKKREEEHKDKAWHRVERVYGSFQRSLTLPKGVNGDQADATFKDGVLTVVLPKSEQARPRTLKVK
jgi:HSP20 family protein